MNGRNYFSLMKTTCCILLFVPLCLSIFEVARGDNDLHLNRDKDNTQVRWWKIVYGGLIDTIKQWVSSIFYYQISPEAKLASVRISCQLSLL